MDIDPRRKPTYDLLVSTITRLEYAHYESIQEVVAVFPEAAEELERHHAEYCTQLRQRLACCRDATNESNEPLWLLLETLAVSLNFDSGWTNVKIYDQIQQRLGIPTPQRD